MNARTEANRPSKARTTHTIKHAPTTRAIRAALAVSATMLALAGSDIAKAGTCTYSLANNTESCDGAFSSVPGGSFVPVTDLTLVLGGSLPTSVTPDPGVIGVDAGWGGGISVVNHADITTVRADGIREYGAAASLINYGSIVTDVSTGGFYTKAVAIHAGGDATVTNDGAISAFNSSVYNAGALSIFSSTGDISIDNHSAGSLIANAGTSGNAFALTARADGLAGDITINQSGVIQADSIQGGATGILATAHGDDSSVDITLTATSAINAQSSYGGSAIGINANDSGSYGELSIDNSGEIDATDAFGRNSAIGITSLSYSETTDTTVTNSGDVAADGGFAIGVVVVAGRDYSNYYAVPSAAVTLSNAATGSISAMGNYLATGIYSIGASVVSVIDNAGDIIAAAASGLDDFTVNVRANGVIAYSLGELSIDNSGTIDVSAASAGYLASATASGVRANAADITIANEGSITVDAEVSAGSLNSATATGVYARGNSVEFVSGIGSNLDVIAVAFQPQDFAMGVELYGTSTSISAAGEIAATASADPLSAFAGATGVLGFGSDSANIVTVDGSSISASATGYTAFATGIAAQGNNHLTLDNAGDIDVLATGVNGKATGLHGFSYGDIAAGNSGDIVAEFDGVNGVAYGAAMFSSAGDITFANSGGMRAESGHFASGIDAASLGTVSVTNADTGSIAAVGEMKAAGIVALGGAGASISNAGSVSAMVDHGYAWGIQAISQFGASTVDNSGDVDAFGGPGQSVVRGIYAEGHDGATVVNSGVVSAEGYWVDGVCANACYGNRQGVSSVTNNAAGNITVTGIRHATGVAVHGDSGVVFANAGDISVTATHGFAIGIEAGSDFGPTTITNSATGNIVVDGAYGVTGQFGFGGYGVTGIRAFQGGDSTINNFGDIAVSAVYAANHSNVTVIANGVLDYFGDNVQINNSGNIAVATANIPNAPYGFIGEDFIANGIVVFSDVHASVDNSGSIAVTASNAPGNYIVGNATVTGVRAGSYSYGALVSNSGSISVTADGVGHARATGVSTDNFVGSAGSNIDVAASAFSLSYATGVRAYSSIDAGGTTAVAASTDPDWSSLAIARGLNVSGSDSASVTTQVESSVSVSASGPSADAAGLFAIYVGHVTIANAGDVDVHASGDQGRSVGIWVGSRNDAAIVNSGSITAEFAGAIGSAYGALISSIGDATFNNSGDITAINADRAVGIELASASSTTLLNSGTITAIASNTGGIAILTGDAVDTVSNSGAVNGEVWTGAGDDIFANAVGGVWRAIGDSGFGAGDDSVSNAGTIFLDNAAIFMGSSNSGDHFGNTGLIVVSGDSLIDMGTGPNSDSDSDSAPGSGTDTIASVPSLNPNAFINDGTISFLDGAPDDMLTITGDFAGHGVLNVDVSQLSGASDMLYVDGSIADGSVSTINVNLVGAPTPVASEIQLARVSGNSTAANFVMGTISGASSTFLTLSGSLTSVIDATNADNDVFSLDVAVSGLADAGALAASLAPGAQSLLSSQVGTWRQRMGVIDKTAQGRPSLWARTFQDSGTIRPESVDGNFGSGGNLAFDQRNSGTEVGADFALSDKLSVGILLAKVDGKQQLNGPGIGRDKLHGETRGLYAAWISPTGFYLDASYRWMSFDAQLSSTAGEMRSSGDADALNVELGYAWTLADGLKIEPQFQYTRGKAGNIATLSGPAASFHADDSESSRDRLGVMVRKSFGGNGTVWTPYVSLNAVREFDGRNAYAINDTFFGATSTQGTSALVEGGLSVQTGHWSVFGSVNWQDGGALQSFSGGQLGLRYNW